MLHKQCGCCVAFVHRQRKKKKCIRVFLVFLSASETKLCSRFVQFARLFVEEESEICTFSPSNISSIEVASEEYVQLQDEKMTIKYE